MFYKPKYCCNCGEKIDRANPSFTDSRRFCDVCQHDFVVHRSLPIVFAALMAAFGIFGLGSYWRSGEKTLDRTTRQFAVSPSNTGNNPVTNPSPVSSNANAPAAAKTNNMQANATTAKNVSSQPPVKRVETTGVTPRDAVYLCGAPTKKGTPCSRRVRGGGRCWQHRGEEALLPPEKLALSR